MTNEELKDLLRKDSDMDDAITYLAENFINAFQDAPIDQSWVSNAYDKTMSEAFRKVLTFSDFCKLMKMKIEKMDSFMYGRTISEGVTSDARASSEDLGLES